MAQYCWLIGPQTQKHPVATVVPLRGVCKATGRAYATVVSLGGTEFRLFELDKVERVTRVQVIGKYVVYSRRGTRRSPNTSGRYRDNETPNFYPYFVIYCMSALIGREPSPPKAD